MSTDRNEDLLADTIEILEADQDRRDVVPRPDLRDVGGAGPPLEFVDLAYGGLPGGGLANSAAYGGESAPKCHIR